MGCYNVQLIKCADGSIKCFEINPRTSTTLCVIIRAGAEPFGAFFTDKFSFRPAVNEAAQIDQTLGQHIH